MKQQAVPRNELCPGAVATRMRTAPQRARVGGDSLFGMQPVLGNHAVLRRSADVLQTKLAIGKPNDQFEQEAERVSDQVMRMSNDASPANMPVLAPGKNSLQRKCSCGGTPGPTGECDKCRKKRLNLQRRAGSLQESTGVPPIVHEVLRSPGQPLDSATRAFMEPRFGQDFSRVRVHDDLRAAASARSVNALAYTVGQDIVFGAGQRSTPSQRFIPAHELAHVVQQKGNAPGGSLSVSPVNDPAEAAADSAAHRVLSKKQLLPPTGSGRRLQRLGGNPGCDAAQADEIHQAIFNANSWVRKALGALVNPLSPRALAALRYNFGAAAIPAFNAGTITARLRGGQADLLSSPFSCTTAVNDSACAGGHCGDATEGSHAVNICTDVTLAITDAVFRAGCVLHEAMHASHNSMVEDFFSGWFGHSGSSPGYPGTNPLANADSYTTLCMELS